VRELITTSRVRAFRSCPRKHHLRYDLRLEPTSSAAPARFGTIFHTGCEHWNLAQQRTDLIRSGSELEVALGAIQACWAGGEDPCPYELARARALFIGYHTRWANSGLEVLEVEREFVMDLVNPDTGAKSRTYEFGGKIDAIVRNTIDGRVYAMEHKTTTLDITPGSQYWERLKLDDQVANYLDAARSLGHDVAGCIYDVARRPTQQPFQATPEPDRKYTKGKGCKACGGKSGVQGEGLSGTPEGGVGECGGCRGTGWIEPPHLYANQRERDETPDEYFARVAAAIAERPDHYYRRGTVVRFEAELQDARWDTWHTARMIRETKLAGRHVRNPGACVQFGSTCSFFPICSGTASADDEQLYHVRDSAHPELSGITDGTSGSKQENDNVRTSPGRAG